MLLRSSFDVNQLNINQFHTENPYIIYMVYALPCQTDQNQLNQQHYNT